MADWQAATLSEKPSASLHHSEPGASSKGSCTHKRSRYDEVRNLYIRQLAFNWMDDSTVETIRTSVGEKISSFVEGDLECAAEILSGLLEIAGTDGDITISDTPSKVSSF